MQMDLLLTEELTVSRSRQRCVTPRGLGRVVESSLANLERHSTRNMDVMLGIAAAVKAIPNDGGIVILCLLADVCVETELRLLHITACP